MRDAPVVVRAHHTALAAQVGDLDADTPTSAKSGVR
jgi:hypothetical protein